MRRIFFFLWLLIVASPLSAGPGLLESMGIGNSDEPLDVEDAFQLEAEVLDAKTLELQWKIAENHYLYRDKIQFSVEPESVSIGDHELPAGENKEDDFFGLTEVYQYDTRVELPLQHSGEASTITLQVRYQGCSEVFNICYPPVEKNLKLDLPATSPDTQAPTTEPVNTDTVTESNDQADDSISSTAGIADRLTEGNLWQVMLGFLGLGLLLAFTPCVFPMIPILSGIIVGQGTSITTKRAFTLSLIYVLSVSVTYTAAGIITGMLGENLQAAFQNPWIIGSFSLLFVILALAMFDLFHLQWPQRFTDRLHKISHSQRGGTYVGVVIMGLLSGLIVGPCLAPPLAGALLFLSQHADPVLGGAALFALSIGMGIPLLIIGTSAGSLLPRAGDWMNVIKAVFGVMLLALAVWMLERIVPGWVSLLMWGGLLMVVAVYLGAMNTLNIEAGGWQKFWKGVGLILMLWGALLIIGAASGGQQLWQPLQNISAPKQNTQQARLDFEMVDNLDQLEQQLAQTDQPVMLDFYADWCTDCKTMERTTFRDADVLEALSGYRLLKLDMTDNNDEHRAMLKALKVFGPPTMLFYDRNGKEIEDSRLIGHADADRLLEHLSALPTTPTR